MKLKKKNLLFLMIMTLTLFFSGCSKIPICEEQDTPYIKYVLDEETSKCIISEEIEKDVCGNGIAEESNDETFCNCPEDVKKTHPTLGCDGKLGDYLIKTCSKQDKCDFSENNKVIEQIKTIEFNEDYLNFKSDITIKNPHILNTMDNNKIKFELSLFNKYDSSQINLKDIVISDLILIDSEGFNIGKVTYNEIVNSPGQKFNTKEIEIAKTTEYSKSISITFKLGISYTEQILNDEGVVVESNKKIKIIESYLDSRKIINPDFYEEGKEY